ncbi:uncharacterized protein DNG_01883 [Cephalotrichum gorgonifer]|uniref:Uncharacterized protein n=1 Tax=Cephalotrichum gorgonifer TaxID=2041049 RepID=A0AAE8MU37_9PEZI|nr:uncharacterized protein DNG_01883 [Cephalotrichum gorgonifer]
MPCFRGIDVFVGAESELQRLPEYPHPDSASVSLVVREQPTSPPGSPSPSCHSGTDGSPARISKINPRISVYIPSLPVPTPVCQLYFKLFANGEGITSWGIDPAKTTTSTVARALYEPDESWNYWDERGDVFKQDGIESKHFYFSDSPENDLLTEDDRVIEVQVFRAKGRRRSAARLDRCRRQDDRGILSPSAGLLECPEDAVFYQWLLIDPKGSPYATFRFHYRSWAWLRRLNVIPPPRQGTAANLFPAGALESTSTLPAASKRSSEPKLDGRQSTPGSLHNITGKHGKQASPTVNETDTPPPNIRAPFPLGNPPELLPARSGSPCIPQPSKRSRDGFLDTGSRRPLPALPSRPSRAKNVALPMSALADNSENPSSQHGVTGPPDLGSKTAIGSQALSPGHPSTPSPVSSPSPRKSRAEQDDNGCVPRPEHELPRQFPPSYMAEPGAGPSSHHNAEFGSKNGIPSLPRGLLGPALTEIPLRGPTGVLMKRLRSEDPFRDS